MYNNKKIFNIEDLKLLHQKYSGPVWVYCAETIINSIKKLKKFDVVRFSQKSCSNIHILKLMRQHEVKVDAVSLGEIERALLAGFQPGNKDFSIIFTADLLEKKTLSRLSFLKIPINVGSIDMLIQLGLNSSEHEICLRINPGFGHGHSNKTNTGGKNSKHGIWYEDISKALFYIKYYNLKLIGLHMHIGSGVNYKYLYRLCNIMVSYVLNYKIDPIIISAGGGLPVPYGPKDKIFDIDYYFYLWNKAKKNIEKHLGHSITLEIEPGRFLVAESGILITQIRSIKNIGNYRFVLIDAGYNDLMRPILYGSYHHISLIPKDDRNIFSEKLQDVVIGGPLCESGDIFTQDSFGNIIPRKLPISVQVGDYLVFHNTGAYGASMSSNYNTRPLLPEVLFENGSIRQIRRKQKLEELFMLELSE